MPQYMGIILKIHVHIDWPSVHVYDSSYKVQWLSVPDSRTDCPPFTLSEINFLQL